MDRRGWSRIRQSQYASLPHLISGFEISCKFVKHVIMNERRALFFRCCSIQHYWNHCLADSFDGFPLVFFVSRVTTWSSSISDSTKRFVGMHFQRAFSVCSASLELLKNAQNISSWRWESFPGNSLFSIAYTHRTHSKPEWSSSRAFLRLVEESYSSKAYNGVFKFPLPSLHRHWHMFQMCYSQPYCMSWIYLFLIFPACSDHMYVLTVGAVPFVHLLKCCQGILLHLDGWC